MHTYALGFFLKVLAEHKSELCKKNNKSVTSDDRKLFIN